MTEKERQSAILKYLDITCWYAKNNSQSNDYFQSQEIFPVIENRVSVILLSLTQKDKILVLMNAMFSNFSVCYFEKSTVQIEKNIASSKIIIYDERLTLETFLDQSFHEKCISFNLNKLDRADVKKQTMINLYAVSDFSLR